MSTYGSMADRNKQSDVERASSGASESDQDRASTISRYSDIVSEWD